MSIFFLKRILSKKIAAFCGALLYLLNLGTLQQFYLPLEMFATHFASLPWLFLFATRYLETSEKRSLWLFVVTTLFSASMAHTSTLFFVYVLGLASYLGVLAIFSWRNSWPRLLGIFLLVFLLNSFWLLPNLYFIKNHGPEVSLSKIHTQFSQKAFLTSKKFGTLKDTATLKNFLFDWGRYDEKQRQFVEVFSEWTPHLNNPVTQTVSGGIFLMILLGVVVAFRQKSKYGIALFPLGVGAFLIIANDLPIINYFFSLLQNKVPLLKEALRFPFTKFSILLMLVYAVYFGMALNAITQLWTKCWKILASVPGVIVTISLIYYMLPAFRGNLISPSVKVKFPEEYFQTINWFSKQKKDGRVAHFPIHTFWGWVYYSWGYEGAGFWWFGLNQPLMDREFDRWSSYNENYYWEASYAVYSHNLELLENVFEKYQIRWLIVDGNIISPSSPKSLATEELRDLLSSSNKISLVQTFGKIKVYQIDLKTPATNFVFLAKDLPTVEPVYQWNNYDRAYLENGTYLTSVGDSVYYPFRSLFTGRRQEELEFTVEDKGDYFLFHKVLPAKVRDYYLAIPEIKREDLALIDPDNLNFVLYANPEIYFNGETLQVKIPKINGYLSAKINPATDPVLKETFQTNIDICNATETGTIKNSVSQLDGQTVLQLQTLGANNCSASFWLPNLPHKISYLITSQSHNQTGQSLLFWLENLNSRKADIETYLPQTANSGLQTNYFVQPPMENDGLGYTLHFDSTSIGRQPAVNHLGEITINPIPYSFLTELNLRSTNPKSPPQTFRLETTHPNPSLYRVTIEPSKNSVLVLFQSFESGWLAYQTTNSFFPFFGKRIKSHILVNNWANGWILDSDSFGKIVLIFWPQYLEYLGFALMGSALLLLLLKRRSRKPTLSSPYNYFFIVRGYRWPSSAAVKNSPPHLTGCAPASG